jgi:hypothetical protein
MKNQYDYLSLRKDLIEIYNSDNIEDKLKLAYHYGNFGFNSIAAKFLIEANVDKFHINSHLYCLDSYHLEEPLDANIFSKNILTDVDLSKVETIQIVCENYDNHSREIGLYIHLIPYIEILVKKYKIKNIYFDCNPRLHDFLEKYFPHIKIGKHENKVTIFDIVNEVIKLGGSSLLRNSIREISKKFVKPEIEKKYVGINWFANNLLERNRSISIGVLINTVGNSDKNLEIKSLQYNNPELEIETFNRYSKNKISEIFYNDINTSVLDIVDSLVDCKVFVGIQSEASVIAFSLYGIPTIVTSSSSSMYWYFINGLNPYIKCAKMRFQGDYESVAKTIFKFL